MIYNIRNITGDLDALIAGNYNALKQVPRSLKELTDYFLHRNEDGFSATQDLKDYIERSEGMGIPSLSLTRNEAKQLVNIFKATQYENIKGNKVSLAKLALGAEVSGKKAIGYIKSQLGLVRKFFKAEQDFTAWREHLLRYAAYLDYKQQMESNSGKPKTWGASIEEEVMALDNIKDRAYKMSNELLGAYD